MTDIARLFERLNPTPDGESAVRHRTGTVSAVNADGTVDLDLGGVVVPDVSVLRGTFLVTGDTVQVVAWAGDLLVLGVASESSDNLDWQSWTPTRVNLNVGTTGSVGAVYLYMLKTVFFDIHVTLGGTGISVGDCTFSVPVAEDPGYSSGSDDRVVVGEATLIDAATAVYHGVTTIDDGVLRPRVLGTAAAFALQTSLSSTVPITWVAGDRMYLHGWYRAAA